MTTAPVTSVALIDGIDVDAVAAAVTACPGVSALFGGRGNAIASYLPGRRVAGVEVAPATVTIHVRSRWGIPAAQLLTQIAAAVSPLLHGHHLEVVVADIDDADPPAPPVAPALSNPPALTASPAVTVPPAAIAPPAKTVPPAITTGPVTAAPMSVTSDPVVDPSTRPPGALPRSTVRPPGSSPAPTEPNPKPAPPAFPTA